MLEAVKEIRHHAFEDCGMQKVWNGYYEGNTKSNHDNADGHDEDHSLRVYHNAVSIASHYNYDLLMVSLAAILQDADDHKLFHTENNANARIFLKGQNIGKEKTE